MDRVFSTRLDESLVKKIDSLVKEKTITKKAVVEKALRMYLKHYGEHVEREVVDKTFGAWQRDETADETWGGIREAFNRGMARRALAEGSEK